MEPAIETRHCNWDGPGHERRRLGLDIRNWPSGSASRRIPPPMTIIAQLNSALTGRYRIERELGGGGMAMVYLARDERHDRDVALKVLRPELAAVIGAERFLNEIKTTANLQHPHILPLHDSGNVDGTVWYVMPSVEGESLRDRLTRETQLPLDDALQSRARWRVPWTMRTGTA